MNEHDYNMISRYVDGEMNADEKREFELMLQQDAVLKKVVELYSEVNQTLKDRLHPGEGEQALGDTMENLRSNYFSPTAKVIPMRKYLRIAIAAAAAIIIVVMIWSPWNQPDLYRQYASIEMTSFAERGAPADSLLKIVTEKFNDKNFSETIPLFETLLATDTANSYLNFYYGIALLEAGQTERSRTQFTKLYNGTSVFRYDAAYFIALSFLKEKDRNTCIQWLNKIPQDASIYSRAEQLMKKL